jgi:lipopolysaccharide transport system ATP-binding protein
MSTAIKIEGLSKLYRLGTVGTGTISHDLNRWWHKVRGKEDPYAMVGQVNDRTKKSSVVSNQSSETAAPANSKLPTDNSRISDPDYVWALRDINLDVEQGKILGIIGRNGAGKSTLLKLLSRVTAPTTGSIKTRGRIASLLEVGTGFHPELTGRENIYLNGAILGMKRYEISEQLDAIVDFSGCAKYLDTPVKRYSSGMMVRLGFSVAAHLKCEILIVDEVLAVGDADFQAKCLKRMENVAMAGRTVLFVSHQLPAIRSICDRVVVVDKGRVACDCGSAEGIAFYHRSIAETRSRISLRESTARTGTQRVRLVSFRIENHRGDDSNEVSAGCPAFLIFRLRQNVSTGRQHRIDVGFGLHLAGTGYCITVDWSSYHDVAFVSDEDEFEVVCNVESMLLQAGDYLVNACVKVDGVVSDLPSDGVGELRVALDDFYGGGRLGYTAEAPLLLQSSWSDAAGTVAKS